MAGLVAGELNLADLGLEQKAFAALLRIQAEAVTSDDFYAVPAALAKAAS